MRLLALRADTMQAMRRLKLPCDDVTPLGLWGSDMFLIGVNNEQFEVLRGWNVQTEDVTPASLRELSTDSPAIPKSPSAGPSASGARITATAEPFEPPSHVSTPPSAPAPGASAAAPHVSAAGGGMSSAVGAAAPRAMPAAPPLREAAATSPITAASPATPPVAPGAPNGAAGTPRVSPAADVKADRPLSGPVSAAPGSSSPSDSRGASPLTLEPSGVTSRARSDERAAPVRDIGASAAPAPAATAEEKNANAGKLRMTVDGEHMYAEIKGGKIVLKDRTYDSLAHARDSIRRERNKVAVWEYFDEGVKAWRVLNRD